MKFKKILLDKTANKLSSYVFLF